MTSDQRIVVLTRQPDAHGVTRLVEEANARGLKLHPLDPHELYLNLDPDGTKASHPDLGETWAETVVIPRLGSLATEYALNALETLELAGAATLNPFAGLLRLRHKFSALCQLATAGLPVPQTAMLRAPAEIDETVAALGSYPVVIKFVRGSQGVGVVIAPDAATVTSVVEAMNLVQYDVMLQRFYPAANGGDLRILVLNGEPRWAVRRQAEPGAFRANFHRGATIALAELTPETSELARRSAACFSLGLAGVDLIESGQGPLVLEVNGSPGYAAIEQAHGVNAAAAILDCALERFPRE